MHSLQTLLRRRFILLAALLVCGAWLTLADTQAQQAIGALFNNLRLGGGTLLVASAQDPPEQLSAQVQQQIAALQAEKQSRNAVQKKLNSQLLCAIKMHRNELAAQGLPTLETDVVIDKDDQTIVDITATLGGTLIERIEAEGGEVISVQAAYHKVRARLPVQKIEIIAALPEVRYIAPKRDPIHNRAAGTNNDAAARTAAPPPPSPAPGFAERAVRVRKGLKEALPKLPTARAAGPLVGSKNSEGDTTHRAIEARNTFGVSGVGIKIGVLSDGVDGLAASQASGDLGPVTILPGQAGAGAEGTAMIEIVHDLAPGAQLFFATAVGGPTRFAQNIRALRAAGCDIIIDDIFYVTESPFQDGQAPNVMSPTQGGVIAQAVNDVTAAGALYFASAGNGGNLADGTAGVWEGDFNNGGPLAGLGLIHDFDPTAGVVLLNTITATAPFVTLFWSDPLGGSGNDYDLYILNAAGTTILAASDDAQNGNDDPFEIVGPQAAGRRALVVKFSGADRFLHLNTIRGQLARATNGQTKGHSAGALAYSVAATPANVPVGPPPNPSGPFPAPFNSSNVSELFSSDGPRRLFFQANGTPFTPGNFSSTGGIVRQKPDITAADGTMVTGNGGFPSTFFGTSAAAPHAGAIAALMKAANPLLTQAQIRAIINATALDIEVPGTDNVTGVGIIQALQAIQAINPTPQALLTLGTVTTIEGSFSNGNGAIEPGEKANVVAELVNPSMVAATNVQVTLSLLNPVPGVTITGPVNYGTINPGTSATNTGNPFMFTLSPTVPCGTVLNFTLTVTFSGGPNPLVFNFSVTVGQDRFAPITTTLDTTAPPAGTGYTATTGTQTGRLFRDGMASECSTPKTFPGFGATTGARRYDAYTITNTEPTTQCVTVSLTNACTEANPALFAVAYLGSFNPANIAANYLADPGTSQTAGGPSTFSFNVPAGATFVIVVHEVNVGLAIGCNYTLDVTLFGCAPPPPMVGPGSIFAAESEVSDQKAGSVLVYNLYSSSAAALNTQNTRISITNINPATDIAVHLFFVDGASCAIADALICLTKNQTASFLASDFDPGTTGYVVAVASDPRTGCPVNFNFLIGDAYVKLASGHAANLGAEAFSALVGRPLACDGNSVTAMLAFDGVNYNRVPRTLAASNIPARANGNDTLLVLNRFGGNLATGAATLTGLLGIFYDDAENAVSFSFSPGTCQFRSSLSNNFPRTVPRLEQFIREGRSGWLRLYAASDIGLLGAVLNFNPNAATNAGAFNQGRNLHKLTLTSTQTLVIPIFPPNCFD